MHTKEQAIELNNLGVEFFVHSRLEEAAIMFDGTIQTIAKTIDVGGSSQEAISRRKEALHLLIAYRSSAPHLPKPKELSLTPCSTKESLINRLRFEPDINIRSSMFSNAFRVVISEETIDDDMSDDEMRFISAIAMYNRGLCHHLTSVSTGVATEPEDVTRALKVAAMLYNLAYKVSIPLMDTMSHVPVFGRLVMVSLNNLALLLHEVHEYEKSRHFFDLLSKALNSFNEDAEDEEFTIQRARFFLNTMLLKKPTTAPSA